MSKQIKPNIYIIIHRSNNVGTVKQQNCCWFKLKRRKKHHLFAFLISTNLTTKTLVNFTVHICRMIAFSVTGFKVGSV